jgi:hypothetical protein
VKEGFTWQLHNEDIESTHPYKVNALRAMLAVPYFEKALYELPESEGAGTLLFLHAATLLALRLL